MVPEAVRIVTASRRVKGSSVSGRYAHNNCSPVGWSGARDPLPEDHDHDRRKAEHHGRVDLIVSIPGNPFGPIERAICPREVFDLPLCGSLAECQRRRHQKGHGERGEDACYDREVEFDDPHLTQDEHG